MNCYSRLANLITCFLWDLTNQIGALLVDKLEFVCLLSVVFDSRVAATVSDFFLNLCRLRLNTNDFFFNPALCLVSRFKDLHSSAIRCWYFYNRTLGLDNRSTELTFKTRLSDRLNRQQGTRKCYCNSR